MIAIVSLGHVRDGKRFRLKVVFSDREPCVEDDIPVERELFGLLLELFKVLTASRLQLEFIVADAFPGSRLEQFQVLVDVRFKVVVCILMLAARNVSQLNL